MSSRSRVTASRISVALGLEWPTAMSLLHGDHATLVMGVCCFVVATIGPHEIDNPRTTLAKGRVYCWESWRTIEVWGDKGSAE